MGDEQKQFKQGPSVTVIDELRRQFERTLIDEKCYLKQSLTLHDLAQKLGTNTSYLSRMIRDSYQMNFPTYLNSLRVKDAKQLLKSEEANKFSIETISEKCGYKCKSTFNKAFRNLVGITPNEYRKSI